MSYFCQLTIKWKTLSPQMCWCMRNHVIPNLDPCVLCIQKVSAEAKRGTYTVHNIAILGYAPDTFFFFITPLQSWSLHSRPKDVTN